MQLSVVIAVKLSKFHNLSYTPNLIHLFYKQGRSRWVSPVPERWFSWYQTMPFPLVHKGTALTNAVVGRGAGELCPANCERSWYSA